jgi:hypothetical protein
MWTRYSLSCDSPGFSIMEFLVVSFMSALLMGSVLSASIAYKKVLGKDIARTRLNQNLRGAIDVLGIDARIAGENLSASFPAVELADGGGGGSDSLTIRRNLLDEVLPVCQSINAGSSTNRVYFSAAGNVAGCAYSGHLVNFNAWRAYRVSQGGTVKAFIFNTSTKSGEFFNFTGETDTGALYYITKSGGGNWAHSYPVGAAAVYILEEWQYRLQSGTFQIVQNRDTANPFNVAFDVTDFQVTISMQDGSSRVALNANENWTRIGSITASLTGNERYNGEVVARTLSGSFFPRNILSN